MEYKHFKLNVKKLSDAGEFEGYAAVKKNVDAYGDIIEDGAFKRTIQNQKKFPILFMHDPAKPIGISEHIEEDRRGLFTRGKLDLSTELGRMVYSGLKKGYISEMSIGYKVIQDGMNKEGHRLLKEVKLLEYSLITKGFAANDLAQVSGFKTADMMERLVKLEQVLEEGKKEMDKGTKCSCGTKRSARQEEMNRRRKEEMAREEMDDDMYDEEVESYSRDDRDEMEEEEMGEEEMRSRRRRRMDKDLEEQDDEPGHPEEDDDDMGRMPRRRGRVAEEHEDDEPEMRRRRRMDRKDYDGTFDEGEHEAEEGMKPPPPKKDGAARMMERMQACEDRLKNLMHRLAAVENNNQLMDDDEEYPDDDEGWLDDTYAVEDMADTRRKALSQGDSSFDTLLMEAKEASGSTSLPLAPKDHKWDGAAAQRRVFKWAGENGDKGFDPKKVKSAFFYCDPKNPRLKGSYKLPFADVINGKLHAVPKALSAVEGALNGARGGVEIPSSDKSKIRSKVNVYKKRMGEGEKKSTSSLIKEMKDILGGLR